MQWVELVELGSKLKQLNCGPYVYFVYGCVDIFVYYFQMYSDDYKFI
jgi:hypothetical protein